MRIPSDRIFRFAIFIFILASLFGCMCCTMPACCAETVVVAATFRNERGSTTEAKGTAFVIHSNERGSVLLTCKHVVEEAGESVWIAHNGEWVKCNHVLLHPTEDVASFECSVQLKATPLVEEIPQGSQVVIDGAGPTLQKNGEEWFFRGKTVADDEVEGDGGLAIIQGDSGGPVYVKMPDKKYAVGGIAYAYPGTSPEGLTRRDQHCRFKTVSLYIPAKKFTPWLTAQYCPNGQCPIQIRPQVIQPFGPLGFPRGPARVIGIAEPVPQQYVPAPRQPQSSAAVGIPGPQGPPGPQGEPGVGVDQEALESTVNAWLDHNIDNIRGPVGEAPDLSPIVRRLSELEQKVSGMSTSRSVDLELVGDSNTILGRSRITVGKSNVTVDSKTADGKPAGSRSYSLTQPIKLNLSGKSK